MLMALAAASPTADRLPPDSKAVTFPAGFSRCSSGSILNRVAFALKIMAAPPGEFLRFGRTVVPHLARRHNGAADIPLARGLRHNSGIAGRWAEFCAIMSAGRA